MKYRVSFGNSLEISKALSQLNESVEGYMNEGYMLVGSIKVVYENGFFSVFQSMIKEE